MSFSFYNRFFCCRFLLWQMVKALEWVRKFHMLYFNLYASRLCSSMKKCACCEEKHWFYLTVSILFILHPTKTIMIYVSQKHLDIWFGVWYKLAKSNYNSINLVAYMKVKTQSWLTIHSVVFESHYVDMSIWKRTTKLNFTVGSLQNTKTANKTIHFVCRSNWKTIWKPLNLRYILFFPTISCRIRWKLN